MKKIYKKLSVTLILLIVLGGINIFTVCAQSTSPFSNSVNSSYSTIYSNFYKTSSENAIINWNTSSQSGSHNMWFRIINSVGSTKFEDLFSYLEHREFSTTTGPKYYYSLQARRENSVDPITYITGDWRA